MTEQSKIVAAARSWIGTPFHHQARVKGKGCDCFGLIIGVARELNLRGKNGTLVADHDEVTYPKMLNSQYVVDRLSQIFDEIPVESAEPGDVVLFKIHGNPQHLAILSDYSSVLSSINVTQEKPADQVILGIIHCTMDTRGVVEHRLDDDWLSKIYKAYRWHLSSQY